MKPILKKQSGLSLIELMIAVALGIFLTAGMISLFSNAKQTYRVQENLSRMQENARFAIGFLTSDIRMADYSGCNRKSLSEAANHLDTAHANYVSALHSFDNSIAGSNGTPNANSALDLSDSITIKAASDSGLTVQTPYASQPSDIIKIPPASGLLEGDIILISDCSQADIIQINNTSVNIALGNIEHLTGSSATVKPGNINASITACGAGTLHCLSKVYQGDASILRLSTLVYTIENGVSGRLGLYRNGQELVEGIDNMQILYGEDTNGDNSADYYVPAGTAGLDMEQVVSIRISLLLTSIEDNLTTQAQDYTYNSSTATPADRRFRQVFTSTIAVRNRLP